jgi:hypothetical protein
MRPLTADVDAPQASTLPTSLRWGSTGLVVHQLACTSTAPGEIEPLHHLRAGKQTHRAAQSAYQLLKSCDPGAVGTYDFRWLAPPGDQRGGLNSALKANERVFGS